MVDMICRECGNPLTWIEQYERYYCHECQTYPPTCPICDSDLSWILDYTQYYCPSCLEYPNTETLTEPPTNLSPNDIMTWFHELKAEYEAGDTTEEEYQQLLEVFKFSDETGRIWTMGVQSGNWYYFDNDQWVPSQQPPSGLLDLADFE